MHGDRLVERFEAERGRLQAVAYRLLGSASEADDAVQEAWLRISRSDTSEVDNLSGWLTTVVARVCLNMLRARRSRREEPLALDGEFIRDAADPERDAVLAESVGLAMLAVLQRLPPAERVAFVLHDVFGVSFEEIADIVGRSPVAARQLASRGRRRVHGASEDGRAADVARQRDIVEAFLMASRAGDFQALLALLDPDVVLRADGGAARPAASRLVRGASAVAGEAASFAQLAQSSLLAIVNGTTGLAVRTPDGRPFAVIGFTVAQGKIVELDILTDPDRLSGLQIEILP
jgi:RNA polymerase sigma-70 factor (ECF subfamily)